MHGLSPVAHGPLLVRGALESDVDRLLEIHVGAFPDPRPMEVRRHVFLHNRLGGLEHLRVVELHGELVAHAFAFPVGTWFGGKEVQGTAIASVGVALESRGQGIAGALLGAIHAEASERGDAFSLLYPFRQGFYARMGYAPVARQRVLNLSPRAIPKSWNDPAMGTLRRAEGRDRVEIARVYRAAARVGTGFLERPERAWEQDFLDERRHWLVLERDGVLEGYLSFRLHQSEPHARVRANVHEVVAADDAPRRRLFAGLAALGDQIGDITVAVADDDPLDWAFLDADRDRSGTEEVEHPLGVVSTGPMIRCLDAKTALLARGYATDGSIDLAIDDEPPFGLHVRDGAATITEALGAGTIQASKETLASVVLGGLRLEDAARIGWLGPANAQALRVAGPLFRLPAFFTVDAF